MNGEIERDRGGGREREREREREGERERERECESESKSGQERAREIVQLKPVRISVKRWTVPVRSAIDLGWVLFCPGPYCPYPFYSFDNIYRKN